MRIHRIIRIASLTMIIALLGFFVDIPQMASSRTAQAAPIAFTKIALDRHHLIQGSQTITFNQPSAHSYGDYPFSLDATASSNLAVNYTSATPGVCLINAMSQVELIGVGTCELTAEQPGDANYLPADSVTRSFAITKAPQTVIFNQPNSHTYGDESFNPGATASSGLAVRYASTTPAVCTSTTSSITIIAAGMCTLSANQPGNDNYAATAAVTQSFTVNQANVVVTPQHQDRQVGSPNLDPFPVLYTGFADGEDPITSGMTGAPTCATDATLASAPGVYTITCTIGTLSASNYTFTGTTGTLNVESKAIPTIAVTQPADIIYGTPLDITPLQASASFNGMPLTGTFVYSPIAGTQLQAGNGQILEVTFTPTDSSNYAPTTAQVQINVLKATLHVTVNPQTRPYGNPNPTLRYTTSGLVPGDTESMVTGNLVTAATASSSVSDYAITQGTLKAANYVIECTPNTLVVTKAALIVTANPQTRVYGAANPTLTFTATGFMLSEDISVLIDVLATTATPSSPVGSYIITQGTLKAANYAITFTGSMFTVTKAQLGVVALQQSRTYGDDNPKLTYTATGLINTDTNAVLTGQPDTTAVSDSPVGSYAITQGTLDAPNYDISFSDSVLTVTPAKMTLVAKDMIRKVNTPNPVLSFLYGGFANDETLATSGVTGSPTCTTTASIASPIGPYPITCAVGTLLATNYTFAFEPGTLTVTAKEIPLITWPTPADITYGRPLEPTALNAHASFNGSPIGGNFVYAPGAGSHLAAGNGHVLKTTFTPADTGIYASVTEQVQINVLKAPVTVKADAHTRTYGADNPPLTYTLTGFVANEHASVVTGEPDVSTSASAGSPVGSYPIMMEQGSLGADNYRFILVDSDLTIVPSTLIVQADDQDIIEHNPLPTLTKTFSGFVHDETLATSDVVGNPFCTTTATSSSPAGTYPIICTLGTLQSENYRFSFEPGSVSVKPVQFITIDSVTLDPKRKPIVKGKATPNSAVLVEIDEIGTGSQVQANTVAYVVQSDTNGDWSLTTDSATPQSGNIPANGFALGTQLLISAQLLDATNAPVSSASSSVVQMVGFHVYLPILR